MTREITKPRDMKLARVTPRAMRCLKENGLLTENNLEYVNACAEVFTNEEKLKKLCDVLYENPPEDLENVDLGEINSAIRAFFSKAFGA
jgi:hypothetical protein